MAKLNQLVAQIRFGLDQLSATNGQHNFEHICRHIARARICSNILPASGPVAAGGDQGRDFETFRTYLNKSPIAESSFIGLISEGPVVFACTITEKKHLTTKIKSDIKSITSSGEAVIDIHYFCTGDVPVAKRHTLKQWAKDDAGVSLEIHDGQAISEYLSDRELFWIAEEYVNIPSELYPLPPSDTKDKWYYDLLNSWKNSTEIPDNYSDFTQIKSGIRHATHSTTAKQDLLFWIKLMEALRQASPTQILKNKAFYEITVANLRGLNSLVGLEQQLREYFTNIDTTTDLYELVDIKILWTYCYGALYRNLVQFTSTEMNDWRRKIIKKIEAETVSANNPGRLCTLLWNRGEMYLFPDLGSNETPDVQSAIAIWLEVASLAENAHLFPLDTFSDSLTQLLTLSSEIIPVSNNPDFRKLTRLVDDLLSKRHGGFAAAEKCRNRAVALYKKNEFYRALNELHEAKIKWYADETLKGSILATLFASDCYQQLGLVFAAKYYALASAHIALHAFDEKLKVYVPRSLTDVACCDFIQGAFCSFFDFSDLVLLTFRAFDKEIDKTDVNNAINRTLFHASSVHFFSKYIAPDYLSFFNDRTAAWLGLKEELDEIIKASEKPWKENISPKLQSTLEDQMIDFPFNDFGKQRTAHFKALGINWKFSWDNTYEHTLAAEELLATIQILLADFADIDLCLVRTTVEVRVDTTIGKTTVEPLPSNDSSPWVVKLSIDGNDNIDVVSAAVTLLSSTSLLPRDTFMKHLDVIFQNGLPTKAFFIQRYSSLYREFISKEQFEKSGRKDKVAPNAKEPFNPIIPHQLAWFGGPGPGYSVESAVEKLKARYESGIKPIRYTLQKLIKDPSFIATIKNIKTYGWLDWHILSAVSSLVVNYRLNKQFPLIRSEKDLELRSTQFIKLMRQEEDFNAEPIPLNEVSADKLRYGLNTLMLSTIKGLGFTIHRPTPDLVAISDFLDQRYKYWTDDIDHPDYGF